MIAPLRDSRLRVLAAAMFLWLLGFSAYDPLLAIHARNLGATAFDVGLLFGAGALVLGAGFLAGGLLSDRYPRRSVMLASWFGGAAAPLVYLAAPSWPWLLAGLVLYNLSVFGLPAVNAYLAATADRRRMASAFAVIAAANALGALLGPVLGGALADRFGIRAAFGLGFAAFAASSVIALGLSPDPTPVAAASWREAFAWRPLARFAPLLLAVSVAGVVPYLALPFVGPYLREVIGLSLTAVGALTAVAAASGLLLAPLFGRLGDAVGRSRALAGSLAVEAAGHALLVVAPPGALVVAFAMRPRVPARSLSEAWLASAIPLPLAGRAFGLMGLLGSLLSAAAASVGGIAYALRPALPFLVAAAAAAGVALAIWIATRREARR